jgi:hypothetical protein
MCHNCPQFLLPVTLPLWASLLWSFSFYPCLWEQSVQCGRQGHALFLSQKDDIASKTHQLELKQTIPYCVQPSACGHTHTVSLMLT